MGTVYFMYSISTLLIIFGFIALLTQKVYIDPNTNQPTEIQIPFFGKLKTNIPSIAFLFLGFMLAFITFAKSYHPEVKWEINGSVRNLGDKDIDWSVADVILIPMVSRIEISDRGIFTGIAMIEEGKALQDAYTEIVISHPNAGKSFYLKTLFDNYNEGKESLIEISEKQYVKFKPLPVEQYPGRR